MKVKFQMKKLFFLTALFCICFFSQKTFAVYVWEVQDVKGVYQCFYQNTFHTNINNPDRIAMYYKELSADGVMLSLAGVASTTSGVLAPEDTYTVEPFYFDEFEYVPPIKTDILTLLHSTKTFSIPTERPDGQTYFFVKYYDEYDNPVSAGYPKLTITYPNLSSETYTMQATTTTDVYFYLINLPKGEYKYTYIATNDNYLDGEYSVSGDWYVTSRPYGFERLDPPENSEISPDGSQLGWRIRTDESPDILKYEFYLGFDNNKPSLVLTSSFSYAAAVSPFEGARPLPRLNHKRRYFWYMKIYNKYDADIETDLYSFITGGTVEKFYNAPNPFNPARGQKTKFLYTMEEDGNAKITIYSEYGDKVYESAEYYGGAQTSPVIMYDGKDNSGRMLYNGSYIAVLTKKYGGRTKTEKCRILVIK